MKTSRIVQMKNGFWLAFLRTGIGRVWWVPVLLLLATAVAVKAGDYTYATNSDNTITITKYLGPGGAVVIPAAIEGKTVTSIGDEAFFWYNPLTSVIIPNSVTNIGDGAFALCRSLSNVMIGNGVTSVGNGTFALCYSLSSITVDVGNSVYSSVNGVLFDKSQTTLIQYPEGKAGSYTIPNSVTSIVGGAFASCDSLTSVTIPDNVTSIGDYVFYACSGLTNVTIPNSVTNIGEDAFEECASLTSMTIPNSVTNIGEDAFGFCWSLTSITIGNGVASIGNFAFESCASLMVYFVGNAPSIGSSLFYKTGNVLVYHFPGTTGWGSTFGGRPTAPWIPLITANGLVGDIQINSGDAVMIAIQTINIPYSGIPVDWWVLLCAGSSWYYLNSSREWMSFDWTHSHCHPIYQGSLFYLPATEVLNNAVLSAGSYTFYFVLGYPMSGVLNLGGEMLLDSVNVTVR